MALINKLTDLGDAVRERSGLTNKLTLDEMADVVRNIPQPDLSPYATIEYVDEQIETIELTPGPAGKDGQDYVLTEEDKQEIAGMVEVSGGGGYEPDNRSIILTAENTLRINNEWLAGKLPTYGIGLIYENGTLRVNDAYVNSIIDTRLEAIPSAEGVEV